MPEPEDFICDDWILQIMVMRKLSPLKNPKDKLLVRVTKTSGLVTLMSLSAVCPSVFQHYERPGGRVIQSSSEKAGNSQGLPVPPSELPEGSSALTRAKSTACNLAHQNRTIAIASDFRVDRAKSPEIPQKEGVLGSEIAARNRKSLATFYRTLKSQCSIAVSCLGNRCDFWGPRWASQSQIAKIAAISVRYGMQLPHVSLRKGGRICEVWALFVGHPLWCANSC